MQMSGFWGINLTTKKMNKSELIEAVEETEKAFQRYYLDWINNFLTVNAYARHHGITEKEAKQRIRIGKLIHNKLVK